MKLRHHVKCIIAGQGISPHSQFQTMPAHKTHRRLRIMNESVGQRTYGPPYLVEYSLGNFRRLIRKTDIVNKEQMFVKWRSMDFLQSAYEVHQRRLSRDRGRAHAVAPAVFIHCPRAIHNHVLLFPALLRMIRKIPCFQSLCRGSRKKFRTHGIACMRSRSRINSETVCLSLKFQHRINDLPAIFRLSAEYFQKSPRIHR